MKKESLNSGNYQSKSIYHWKKIYIKVFALYSISCFTLILLLYILLMIIDAYNKIGRNRDHMPTQYNSTFL